MTNYEKRAEAFNKIIQRGKSVDGDIEEKIKHMPDDKFEELLQKHSFGREEQSTEFASSKLVQQNVKLMKEYMLGCKSKFSFEGYQMFIAGKLKNSKDDGLTQAIHDNIEKDNKQFKQVASSQYHKMVTTLLASPSSLFDRVRWAIKQMDRVECTLVDNKLVIKGSISMEAGQAASSELGMIDIKSYDLTPHMKWIKDFETKKQKRAEQDKKNPPSIGKVIGRVVTDAVEQDPKKNLNKLKSDLNLGDGAHSNIRGIDDTILHNILYKMEGTYGVKNIDEKIEIQDRVVGNARDTLGIFESDLNIH